MRLHSLVYLLSIIVSTHQATIQDTLNDLSTIKTEVIGLDNAITNFPAIGGTLVAGLVSNPFNTYKKISHPLYRQFMLEFRPSFPTSTKRQPMSK